MGDGVSPPPRVPPPNTATRVQRKRYECAPDLSADYAFRGYEHGHQERIQLLGRQLHRQPPASRFSARKGRVPCPCQLQDLWSVVAHANLLAWQTARRARTQQFSLPQAGAHSE